MLYELFIILVVVTALILIGSCIVLIWCWGFVSKRFLSSRIELNGHILKCDLCDKKATRVFNSNKKCDDHRNKKIVILKSRKAR